MVKIRADDLSDALVTDLRLTPEELSDLLAGAVLRRDALDAYLALAGLSQMLRDYLEDDPARLGDSAAYFAHPRFGVLGRVIAAGALAASRCLVSIRRARASWRHLHDAARACEGLMDDFAMMVISDQWVDAGDAAIKHLVATPWPSSKVVLSVRIPASFRSFDQHPRDLANLARGVLVRWPPCSKEIMVLGLRTSGSYLAPLLAAALSREGYEHVRWATIRPGNAPSSATIESLQELAQSDGLVLLVDDPPSSGGSLARVAAFAARLGVRVEQIGLALALFEGRGVPASLRAYAAVTLPWSEWDIHQRLSIESVKTMIAERWPDLDREVELRPMPATTDPQSRGHAREVYQVSLPLKPGASYEAISLAAEGSGLGYLGRHALAVAQALPGLTSEVFSFRDGVTLRRWYPDSDRVELDSETRSNSAVRYVAARRASLLAHRDASASMGGQDPVWEVASRLLVELPLGPLGLALRVVALDAAVRLLLAPAVSTIVDGRTGPGAWFEKDGNLMKTGFADRDFSHLNLACYDAAYDLAGLAAHEADRTRATLVRRTYEHTTGEFVGAERWLLYQWVHLWNSSRLRALSPYQTELAVSRIWQDWVRERLMSRGLDGGAGPLCALDIDGVLESSRLNASVLMPSSARAVLSLATHGYVAVLATGRSIVEVEDRCRQYQMAGGVAEYGGVAYNHRTGATVTLVAERDARALDDVREFLEHCEGVHVDASFTTMVRAYQLDAHGNRRALHQNAIEKALRSANGRVRVEIGLAQCDFVAMEVNKATGLATLAEMLGVEGPLALAVGDSASDLPMLKVAQCGFMLGHADHAAGDRVRITKLRYQRGLLEAVDEFLEHPASGCQCQTTEGLPPQAELVRSLLYGIEGELRVALSSLPATLAAARKLHHKLKSN